MKPRRLMRVLDVLLAAGLAIPFAIPASAQSDQMRDYVILARDQIKFGPANLIASGNVGVDGPNGLVAAKRHLASSDDTHIVTDIATIKPPASLFSIYANQVAIQPRVIVRSPNEPVGWPAPIMQSFPSVPAMLPGLNGLEVPAGQTVTLAPGAYGAVKLKRRTTVVFTGGTYTVASLAVGNISRLLFAGPTVLNIAGPVKIGAKSVVGPVSQNLRVDDISIRYAGDKFRILRGSTVAATIFAPDAIISVGESSLIKGQLLGREVHLGYGVVVERVDVPLFFGVRTPTPTNTGTPTQTPTVTLTPTPTEQPSETPVPPTATATPSATLEPTTTATATTAATATATGTPCPPGLSLEVAGVDQVALISQTLGGTVTHRGAAGDPLPLTQASDYTGPVNASTWVDVTLPNYIFASAVIASNLAGNSEPGNSPSVVLGKPTDVTFTTPGTGSPDPDGTAGDGSLVMGASGNFVTVNFGVPLSYTACTPHALVVFTDTAGPGTARVELLSSGSVVDSFFVNPLQGGAPGTAFGGAMFTINALSFEEVRVVRVSGTIEIDAIAVLHPFAGGGDLVICGNGMREGGEECDDGNLVNGDGCSNACRIEYPLALGMRACSLTQGAWGSSSGVVTGPGGFLTRDPTILPVSIGGPERSTTLHTKAALNAYLPKGGTPTALLAGDRNFYTAGDVLPDGGGVLAGQTVSLTLSVALSEHGTTFVGLRTLILPALPFCTQRLSPGVDGLPGTEDDEFDLGSPVQGPFVIDGSVATANNTVGDLLLMANQYLRGASSAPTITAVNAALDTVNRAFDECTEVVACP